MPWTTGDVDKHNKGLSDKDKKQWVAVANSVLSKCVEDGGDEGECAASAIKQANGVVNEEAETMPDKDKNIATEPLDLASLRELLAQALAFVDAKLAEQAGEEPAETDMEAEPAEVDLAESAIGHVIGLAESDGAAADSVATCRVRPVAPRSASLHGKAA